MARRLLCDAPGCDEMLDLPTDTFPWWRATLHVQEPDNPQPDPDDDSGFIVIGWGPQGVQVEACTREHLRIAMAHKIAELTDEHAQP